MTQPNPGKWYTVEVHRVVTKTTRVRVRIPDSVGEDDRDEFVWNLVSDHETSPLQFVQKDEWMLDDEQYEVQAVDLDSDQSEKPA